MTNHNAYRQLKRNGYTSFGAFATYDPHLKKWRVMVMATREKGGAKTMLAPDVFYDEQSAERLARMTRVVFSPTYKPKKKAGKNGRTDETK